MSEYQSCMGGGSNGPDPREKYQITNSSISILKKDSGFFKKWKLQNTFNFNNNTTVIRNNTLDSGSGRLTLENKNGKAVDFFVYKDYENFVNKLKKFGLKIDSARFSN